MTSLSIWCRCYWEVACAFNCRVDTTCDFYQQAQLVNRVLPQWQLPDSRFCTKLSGELKVRCSGKIQFSLNNRWQNPLKQTRNFQLFKPKFIAQLAWHFPCTRITSWTNFSLWLCQKQRKSSTSSVPSPSRFFPTEIISFRRRVASIEKR